MSRQLTADYGRGFAKKSLRRMIQFADLEKEYFVTEALRITDLRLRFAIAGLRFHS